MRPSWQGYLPASSRRARRAMVAASHQHWDKTSPVENFPTRPDGCLQILEYKELSWGISWECTWMLAEITYRNSQSTTWIYLLYLLLKILSCIFNQWFTLIIQYGEALARRRKADRPVSIASRGTRERWGPFSSHVRPQGWPPSLRGAGVVQPLGGSSGHLPERCRTYATG